MVSGFTAQPERNAKMIGKYTAAELQQSGTRRYGD
jgi:hypothetical protein